MMAKSEFVRLDKDLQEILDIPLNVVRPVHPEIQTTNQKSTEKREMKAVSRGWNPICISKMSIGKNLYVNFRCTRCEA
jgi:hypothetical protein